MSTMDQQTLNDKVHNLRKLQAEVDRLQSEIDCIKGELKEYMKENEQYHLVGDDWKITWELVQSRRFDQSAFKNMHPEMYETFKTLSESRRFILN